MIIFEIFLCFATTNNLHLPFLWPTNNVCLSSWLKEWCLWIFMHPFIHDLPRFPHLTWRPVISFAIIMHFGGTEPKLSEVDLFNEACALKLAAQFSRRNRARRELDQLLKQTDFTRSELKLLYWGWKCSCPSGSLTESNFKEIYAQFFPQAGQSCNFISPVC